MREALGRADDPSADSRRESWFPSALAPEDLILETFREPPPVACACCGREAQRIAGRLHSFAIRAEDERTHVVYFADSCPGRRADGARLMIGVGNWLRPQRPPPHRAVMLLCRVDGEAYAWRLPESMDELPVGDLAPEPMVGAPLWRPETIGHPDLPRVMQLAEMIVATDPTLLDWLRPALADAAADGAPRLS